MMSKGRAQKGDFKNDLSVSQDEIELADLMKKAQQGDAASYKVLLSKVNQLMQTFVQNSFLKLGLSQTNHEDVVQEVLLAIHLKRSTFDPTQFFLPWLYAIARYKIIDSFRKLGVEQRTAVPLDDEINNLAHVATFEGIHRGDVTTLLDILPPKQKEIIKLVKLDGLTLAEVASRTGYSLSDVKVSVHRALKTLIDTFRERKNEN